ncbi:MAG: class I SAM-dependent methyltransferase [Bacteroidia bacterium]
MKPTDKNTILDYQYPKLLMKFPFLLYFVYWANYLTQLRKWYVVSAWRKLLKESQENALILDFGAGEAQYLVPYCKKHPNKIFYSLDNRQSNVQLAEAFGINNLKAAHIDIENNSFSKQADLGLCVGVMQYLANDEAALANMNKSLKQGALLLLYVPINGIFLTRIYKKVFDRYEQYESINARKRVYTEHEICNKLVKAGFNISKKTFTYGDYGRYSHEILNTFSTLIFSGGLALKLIALVLLLLFFPLIILLMLLDFNQKKKNGNGLLIECFKQ